VTVALAGPTHEDFALTPAWDYAVSDSRSGGVVYQWIDATGGVRYQLEDDAWATVDLPPGEFFSFYGQDYAQLFLGSNGYVTFDAPYPRFGGIIPFEGLPNGVIHALGEDLNPGAGSDYGTGFDNGIYALAVDGKLVLQYNEVEHWAHGDPETFQLVLDPARDEIKVQYREVSWPDFTTVGVENGDGTRATVYSYANSAALESGLAVTFTPLFGQPGQSCKR
jgi:hypothetical protein